MVDGLFFYATLTGCRGSHTPFVQQLRKRPPPVLRRLSRTQALLGRVVPGVCVPVSGIEVRSLVGLSAHSAFDWLSAQCTARMLLLSDEPMSCCAAGKIGCTDLWRRASALDRRVSAEWSRCPGSMARRARDSGLHCDEDQQVGCL